MERTVKLVVGVIVAITLAGLISSLMRQPQSIDNAIDNIPAITSEQYLRAVDNRYPDNQLIHCMYTNLLNKYGVQEVIRVDALGVSDPDNQEVIDKFTESMQGCQ